MNFGVWFAIHGCSWAWSHFHIQSWELPMLPTEAPGVPVTATLVGAELVVPVEVAPVAPVEAAAGVDPVAPVAAAVAFCPVTLF